MKSEPSVYNYRSFRKYLNDWILYGRGNPYFSLGVVTRDIELSSIAEFSNILNGRRTVSSRLLHKVINYLNLSPKESSFLELIGGIDRNKKDIFICDVLVMCADFLVSVEKGNLERSVSCIYCNSSFTKTKKD